MYNDSGRVIDEDSLARRSLQKRKLLVFSDEEDSYGASDTDDNNSEELEEDEGLCPICLTEFTNQMVGIPKTCNHIFCLECLQEWAKKINNCPVDRTKFNFVSVYNIKDGPLIEELYIEDKESKEDEFEDPPTYCEVCGSCDREDSLLLCDDCDNGYHLDCLVPPLLSVPYDEWYCPECQPNNQLVKVSSFSEFIGDEELLMKIFEDHSTKSDFSKDSSESRVRTVARVKNERRQSRSQEHSTTRIVIKDRRNKRKRLRKSAKKMNKEFNKKKVKDKDKDDRLKKENKENNAILSIYGNPYDLNELYEVSDEEHKPSPVRHTVSNTTDVVGSILGGFVTLDPKKVVVERDGSLKEKKQLKKITKVTYKPVPIKKKKIRFLDDSDDEDFIKNENNKFDEENLPSPKKTIACSSSYKEKEFSDCIIKQVQPQREILNGQWLKLQEDVDLNRKIKKQLAEMREKSKKKEFKSMASLCSISGFKIPKKNSIENIQLSLKENSNLTNPSKPTSNASIPNESRKPIENKSVLSLQKKIELYNQGKYKSTLTRNRLQIVNDSKERCLSLMRGSRKSQKGDDVKQNSETKSFNAVENLLLEKNPKDSNVTFLGNKNFHQGVNMWSNVNMQRKLQEKVYSKNGSKEGIQVNKLPVKVSFTEYKNKMQQEKLKESLSSNNINENLYINKKETLFEELFGDASISFLEETKAPISDLLETVCQSVDHDTNHNMNKIIPSVQKFKKNFASYDTNCSKNSMNQLNFLSSEVKLKLSADSDEKRIVPAPEDSHKYFRDFNELYSLKYVIKPPVTGDRLQSNSGIPIAVVYPRSNLETNSTVERAFNINAVIDVKKQKIAPTHLIDQKVHPIEKVYLDKIKALLKYDYKSGILTKDQWKGIVKQCVKKIQSNIDYYKQDGMVDKLVASYLTAIKDTVVNT